MSSATNFATGSTPSTSFLLQLASSGALNEISNVSGAPRDFIRGQGLVDEATNKTQRALLFAIYQTGTHGPQNGFRLCLVKEGFEVGSVGGNLGEEVNRQALEAAEAEITHGAMEWIVLGAAEGVNGA